MCSCCIVNYNHKLYMVVDNIVVCNDNSIHYNKTLVLSFRCSCHTMRIITTSMHCIIYCSTKRIATSSKLKSLVSIQRLLNASIGVMIELNNTNR